MIPESKQPVVARALRAAFGVSEFEDIRPLTAGLSTALVFRIVVRGNPYLLRLMMSTSMTPGPGQGDPTRQFACMTAGSEIGIAPHIHYANVEDRILITDFVEAKPFPNDFAPRIASTIRKLHTLPPFPTALHFFDMTDAFIRRFQAAKVLPEDQTEDLFRRYANMAKVYPRNDTDLVASHNDLKPQNILFDGDRVWLVDWEAAFLNDRYVDLAVVANFFVKDEASENAYLNKYFGEPAGDYRRSRFYLMRQAAHIAYATIFLMIAAKSGVRIDSDQEAPDFRDFHQRIVSGEVALVTAEEKLQYGKVHMHEALRNMRTQQFEDAVAQVADFHASA